MKPIYFSLEDEDKSFMLELYIKYHPLIKYKVYDTVGDCDVVNDLTQEALLKLIPKASLLRTLDRYRITAYVTNTAKHVCFDYIRKEACRNKHYFVGPEEDFAVQIPDLMVKIEENYVRNERIDELKKIMLQLSERDRRLLYYKYNMGLRDKEIEEVLGIPQNHVRQYIARAKQRVLRKSQNDSVCILRS
ncbi:sigma-70 family RNA polymerase sigma factor [Paenibacillus sp. FSL R7-0198]|uniref:RNA polymerase sigma factor n=2 Tax=unclassified Paenibacillus TaxID=185978 RepID=UPI0030FA492C